jgi:hypothetical protein
MRARRLLTLMGLLPCFWLASPAMAAVNCSAPPGTAATEQYCELLPSADGMIDATGRHKPLTSVLPRALVKRLRDAGLLGEVLLALPAFAPDAGAMRSAAVRQAMSDPRLGALLPDRAQDLQSSLGAAAGSSGRIGDGFQWTLVASLCALAGVSALRSVRVRSLP